MAENREQNDYNMSGDGARIFGIPPKTAQHLYAAGDLSGGAVDARFLLYKTRNFDIAAKVAGMTRMEVFRERTLMEAKTCCKRKMSDGWSSDHR